MSVIGKYDPLYLVFGASGYIGSNLVPRLLAEGRRVRAAARNISMLEGRDWGETDYIGADALDSGSLPAVVEGVEVAYYLVHSMTAGPDYPDLDYTAAANFGAAAEAAGVKQIIYLSSLVPPNADSVHLLSRQHTGDILRRYRVRVTELRAGIIVGPGSAAFEVMRDLIYNLPVMFTPRWAKSKSPPIALDNILEYLVRLPDQEKAIGGIFEAAGPEYLSYKQMMRTMAEVASRRRPITIPLPLFTPRLSSFLMNLFSTVPINIARALVDGLKYDFYADDEELRQLVPQTLLDFRKAVEVAFAAEDDHLMVSRWTEGAFTLGRHSKEYTYYPNQLSGSAVAQACPESVWQILMGLGGKNGYYYMTWLWYLREFIDWLLGGKGLHRGRRHPHEVRVGDTIDSWRVISVKLEKRLTLGMGLKSPGAGALEFDIDQIDQEHTRIKATAYWHSVGFWGLFYWYSFYPAHHLLFRGLTREICQRAELLESAESDSNV
ncbi:MAG: SDR family oxidoreductase [Gammaproteobacteria bacterium]|nr:SDR family oxidoreductase [Gammaproteobacteria bacterium]